MNDKTMRLDSVSFAPLEPAILTCPRDDEEAMNSAADLLKRAVALRGAEWSGIAYSTRGSISFNRVDTTGIYPLEDDESPSPVDLDTVYELRIWQTNCADYGPDDNWPGATSALLARELRWVNGGGGVQINLWSTGQDDSSKPPTHYYRKNSYLQHGHGLDGHYMTAIEVFGVGNYGNTIMLDELMTGRWG